MKKFKDSKVTNRWSSEIKNEEKIKENWSFLTRNCSNKTLAIALHCQLKINEGSNAPSFNRISIPLIVRMFHGLPDRINGTLEETNNRYTFKTKYAFSNGYTNLNEEAVYVSDLAQNLMQEIADKFSKKIAIGGLLIDKEGNLTLKYSI